MSRQHEERQDIERILRRAAEAGHDPERVARALDHHPAPTNGDRTAPESEVERATVDR